MASTKRAPAIVCDVWNVRLFTNELKTTVECLFVVVGVFFVEKSNALDGDEIAFYMCTVLLRR